MDCKFTVIKPNYHKASVLNNEVNDVEILAGSKLSFKKLNKKEQTAQKILTEEDQKRIHYEKIQHLKKQNRIYTWGDNISDPIINFSDLNIPIEVKDCLKEHNISEPTSIQMQSIPIMLDDRNLLATAPTGSGKTLAFAIPIINCCHELHKKLTNEKKKLDFLVAIVIEPTRILAKQANNHINQFIKNLPIKCSFLENEFDTETSIMITTPNKLLFSLEAMNDTTRTKIFQKLKWLVIDESDRIFENTEGDKSFRLQLIKLMNYCNKNTTRKAFFSATFSYQIEEWCAVNLENVVMVCIGPRNSANTLVEQQLIFAGWEQGKVSSLKMLIRTNFNPPALVFVQSKERAKQLFVELKLNFPKLAIEMISSELSNKEADEIVENFSKGKIHLLVCTELMGRGLDFQNVNLVINFDLPTSIVSYIHRIGRTGRAGQTGKAITYFTESDMKIVRPIATVIHQAGFPVPEYLLQLKKLPKNKKEKLKKHAPKRKKITTNFKWKSTAEKLRKKQNRKNKKMKHNFKK